MQTVEKLFEKHPAWASYSKKNAELDELTLKQYDKLSEADVKKLLIENKWMASLQSSILAEIDAISQRLTTRIKELGERYDETLGALDSATKELEDKVSAHLKKWDWYGAIKKGV